MTLNDFYKRTEQPMTYDDFRVCNCCGKRFYGGMTDLFNFYACEDCFKQLTDNGELIPVDDDGNDGYYIDKEGNGTGIFYTEW